MKPIDTYRDSFLAFLAQGMNHAEAREQFDEMNLQKAVKVELERGDSVRVLNQETMMVENACGRETLFDLCCKASFVERNSIGSEDMEQALALWQAGWTSEDTDSQKHNSSDFWRQAQVMSWYWRRPSRRPGRPGRPGRRYQSTNQAYNAMKKES